MSAWCELVAKHTRTCYVWFPFLHFSRQRWPMYDGTPAYTMLHVIMCKPKLWGAELSGRRINKFDALSNETPLTDDSEVRWFFWKWLWIAFFMSWNCNENVILIWIWDKHEKQFGYQYLSNKTIRDKEMGNCVVFKQIFKRFSWS